MPTHQRRAQEIIKPLVYVWTHILGSAVVADSSATREGLTGKRAILSKGDIRHSSVDRSHPLLRQLGLVDYARAIRLSLGRSFEGRASKASCRIEELSEFHGAEHHQRAVTENWKSK